MNDRLEPLLNRRVEYIMTDEPDRTYTGTVEKDNHGRPFIRDEFESYVVVYDTGVLKSVKERR